MARRSKRRKRDPVPANGPPAGARPEATGRRPPFHSGRLGVLLVLLLLLLYFAVFYRAPLDGRTINPATGQLVKRFEYQLFLFVSPGYYWQCWTGGDGSRVAVADRAPVLLVAAVILVASGVVGWLLIELFGADAGLTRLERFVFAMGVGLNALSLLTLAVGLVGGLRHPLVFAVPLALLVVLGGAKLVRRAGGGATLLPRSRRAAGAAQQEPRRPNGQPPLGAGENRLASTAESPGPDHVLSTEAHPSAASSCAAREWLPGAALWLAAPFVVLIVMGAMLPPRHFDVREYHLEVPKEWYQQGRIDFVAHNVYGNMPLGAEMHALLGMILMRGERDWWWGALAGKTVIAMFAPLTMLALVAAGRRFFSVSAGVVAGLVYISTGWVAHVSMAGLIDGAVGCYLLLALYAVLIWSQQDAERAPDGRATGETRRREEPEGTGGWRRAARGRLLLAGFLAGSAVACKYPAVLFVAIPLAAWVLARGQHWRPFAVFLLALACGCGPWFGKNWVLAGNPTYPLLYEVFGGRTWTAEKSAQWRSAHAVPKDAHGRRYALPQLGAAAADVLLTSKWLSPLLIPLAALSLVLRRRRRMVLALLGMYLYIIAAWWLLTHRIDRFWIPVLPIVALLAGAGATWTAAWLWGRALIAVLFWGLLSNLLVIGSPAVGDVRFLVALEQLRLDLPHDRDPLPSRVNPAHRYLNEAVPDGFGVLLVGDAQPFDLEVPVLYNTCFDDCVLEKLMKGRSAAERRAILGRHKISHVYVDWPELRRYRSPGNYGYAAGSNFVQPALFDELVAQGVLGKPLVLSSAGSPSGARPPQIFPVAGPTRKAGRS